MSNEKNVNAERIDDSNLENVSGGVIFNSSGIIGADKNNPWEVLDDRNGNVIGRYATRDDAIANAGKSGQNHMEVNWDQVQQLRGQR